MKQRLVHIFLTLLVFVYIIFEELVWETIARPVYEYIHALRLLQKIEAKVHHLHPWILLILFLSVFVVVEIAGIFAGVLALQGHILPATLLYLTKIPAAAFAFWFFRVSQDKLLRIGWFKSAYTYVMDKIDRLKDTEVYHAVKIKTTKLKKEIKQLKARYLPKGALKRRIKRIYLRLKKIIKGV